MSTGWICPRCQAVHSPDVKGCNCQPPIKVSTVWPITVPNIPSQLYRMPGCGCTGPCCNAACPHRAIVTCGPNIATTGGAG